MVEIGQSKFKQNACLQIVKKKMRKSKYACQIYNINND